MGAARFLQDLPIRQKLRAVVLIISGISVVVAVALFVSYQWVTSREQRASELEVTSEVVGSQSVAALEFEQEAEAAAILGSVRADPMMLSAAVYRKDGRLFAKYVREGMETPAVPPAPEADGYRFEGGHVLVFHPLVSEGARAGTIYFRADLADIRNQAWTNVAVGAILLLAAGATVLILTGRIGRLITVPIQRLSDVVQSVAANKDYGVRVAVEGRDELGRLGAGFNDMIRAVEEREAALAKARDELEARVKERTHDLETEVVKTKAAQKLIQDKESKLAEAQQIAQMGSWEWDPEADTIDWSDELYRITGALPNKFAGKYEDAVSMTHPDDRSAFRKSLETCRDQREPFESDIRVIRPDGSVRFLSWHGKPVLDDKGRTTRVIGTAQDVTERKRADQAIQKLNEELRARVEEAATANKELEGFSYSVSHDLRAPLRAIHGYSRMLMDDFGDKMEGDGKRFLEVISNNTKRMGQLIDDLLDFSRLGRKALNLASVDMDGLVRQVVDEMAGVTPDRRLEFRIGALPPATADASMLRIVMTNLVSNAIKYTKGRDPAVIEIAGSADPGENRYVIKDNGVGFEMEYAHKLFGVFQRLHRAEDFEGTGVGLALVQRIIQKHGGRVEAEGRVNQGATFTFTLPRNPDNGGGV